MKSSLSRLHQEKETITKEVREKTAGYIIAAFGLVTGLAWNEAIKSVIEFIFPANGNTIVAKFIYAIFLTFIVTTVSVYVLRILKREEGSQKS